MYLVFALVHWSWVSLQVVPDSTLIYLRGEENIVKGRSPKTRLLLPCLPLVVSSCGSETLRLGIAEPFGGTFSVELTGT